MQGEKTDNLNTWSMYQNWLNRKLMKHDLIKRPILQLNQAVETDISTLSQNGKHNKQFPEASTIENYDPKGC